MPARAHNPLREQIYLFFCILLFGVVKSFKNTKTRNKLLKIAISPPMSFRGTLGALRAGIAGDLSPAI